MLPAACHADHPPGSPVLKRFLQSNAVQAVLGWGVALYVRFVFATTRWHLSGAEHLVPVLSGGPTIVAFWHDRQALMPMLWKMARRAGARRSVHVLVSRHRDGRLNGAILQRLGLTPLYGSTYRGGTASSRQMLEVLAHGGVVAITPDGPRGPPREAAPGVARLAAATGARVLPCAAQASRIRRLHTWDRMVVPLPFGRAVIVCCPTIVVAAHAWEEALPEIAAAMTEAAEMADRMCAS